MVKLSKKHGVDILEMLGSPIPRGKASKIPVVRRTAWDDGNCLYLFRHIHTNQVIYSLTHWIDPKEAMKQLTFYGKKSVPSEIRKDLWRPFATVVFPLPRIVKPSSDKSNDHGSDSTTLDLNKIRKLGFSQLGSVALEKLKQLRMLRDYAWKKPGDRIAVSEERLNGTAEPHSVILHNKRTARRREEKLDKAERKQELMNQRATSVADLATTIKQIDEFIIEQLDTSGFAGERPETRQHLLNRWQKLLKKAKDVESSGEISTIEKSINDIWHKLQTNKFSTDAEMDTARKLERQLRERRNKIVRMQQIVDMIKSSNVVSEAFEVSEEIDESQEVEAIEEQSGDVAVIHTETAIAPFKTPELGEKWQQFIKQVVRRYDRDLRYHETWKTDDLVTKLPIHIFWADLYDRKFISTWPANTFHSWIGPRNNRDVYFGAIPPGSPEHLLQHDTQTRTITADISGPTSEELQIENWLADIKTIAQENEQELAIINETKLSVDSNTSTHRDLDPSGKSESQLEDIKRVFISNMDLSPESLEEARQLGEAIYDIKKVLATQSMAEWSEIWTQQRDLLVSLKDDLTKKEERIHTIIEECKTKIEKFNDELNLLKEERQVAIERDVFRGNEDIDQDINVIDDGIKWDDIDDVEDVDADKNQPGRKFTLKPLDEPPKSFVTKSLDRVRNLWPFGKTTPNVS